MLDVHNETMLSLRDASRRIPPSRNGKPTHVSTLLRWILNGVKGVKLDAVRLGGRWVTSVEAIQRFSRNLTSAMAPQESLRSPHPSQASTAEQAEDELT